MRSGFLPARIVHVHPSRACNLACAHCYSSSSPAYRTSLDLGLLLGALRGLREEGYEVLSVSGGEPLVYRDLPGLLKGAAKIGYRNHLVTNGLLLTRQRLELLQDDLQFVAVSFDGARDVHNHVRGRVDAFEKANAALEVLSESKVAFALAFGVSRHSLADVPWAYERAREVGASLVHLRPLVSTGRAHNLGSEWFLTEEDCARLVVLGALLGPTTVEHPRVQVDLVAVEELAGANNDLLSSLFKAPVRLLSDLVNPLVINDAGALVPFTYDIHAAYGITNLTADFSQAIERYKEDGAFRIAGLLQAAFGNANEEGRKYLDWFAHLTRVSLELGAVQGHRRAATLLEPASASSATPTSTRSTPA